MQQVESLDNKLKEFWPKKGPPTKDINKYVKKQQINVSKKYNILLININKHSIFWTRKPKKLTIISHTIYLKT